jgi:glycosyltransferase involved in cell wall biosynthesis
MPAYNCAEFIGEAIESALRQTYPHVEIIVVDDGSTDETIEIVKRYRDVKLFQQNNQGSAVARNLGIKNSKGSYIAFLDSDDVWWPKKLEFQLRAMTESGYGMSYSRFIWWHPAPNGSYSSPEDEFSLEINKNISCAQIHTGWTYADLLLDCIVWTSTVVIEKALLFESGLFNSDFRKGQDYELWLRLSRISPMVAVEQPTALYRIHKQSITHRISDRCFEYEILSGAINKWGLDGPDGRSPPSELINARLGRMLWNHGSAHLKYGNPLVAIDYLNRLKQLIGMTPRIALMLTTARIKMLTQTKR